jgi:bla regulator protein BlaR1
MTVEGLVALWVDAAWQATAVALAALALAKALPRAPAVIRQAVLAIALLKFLTPPLAFTSVGVFALLPRPQRISASAGAGAVAPVDGFSWILLLVIAYVAGVVIVAGVVLVSTLRLIRLRRAAQLPADATRRLTTSVAGRIGVRRRIQIGVSDDVPAPIAFGILKPWVLVPRALEKSLDPAELHAVIGHELAHHRHGHLLWAGIRSLACALWWWNPVVWMVSRTLRHVHEEVCDDEVIQAGVIERDAYCDVLLRAAAVSAPLGVSVAFGDRRHPLADRVERLVSGRGPARVRPLFAHATMVALAVAVLPGVPHERGQAMVVDAQAQASTPVPPLGLDMPFESASPSAPVRRLPPRATARSQVATDPVDAAASVAIDAADRVFDRLSGAIESVVDPPPSRDPQVVDVMAEVNEIVAAEIQAHLPEGTQNYVTVRSDPRVPPMRPFVRALRNELRSGTRGFWRGVGRSLGRTLRLLTGGGGSSSPSPSPSPSPSR